MDGCFVRIAQVRSHRRTIDVMEPRTATAGSQRRGLVFDLDVRKPDLLSYPSPTPRLLKSRLLRHLCQRPHWVTTYSTVVVCLEQMDAPNARRGLDAAAFPHIYDEVVDSVADATTLKALRLTSRNTRRRVDRRLADHLLLRYDGVRSRLGGVKGDGWADGGESRGRFGDLRGNQVMELS